MNADFFFQLAINGLLLGGFYATMALGFSTIWGVMRLINLAHGEFLLLGAYVAWYFFNPGREQALEITSISPLVSFVVILILALIIGTIISEAVIGGRMPNNLQRRGIGVGGALVVGLIAFFAWQANEFAVVSLPVAAMIFVGLALSVGFLLSHAVLGYLVEVPNLWARRGLGYGAGIVLTAIFYFIWRGTGFAPMDPFLSLPIYFIFFFGLGYAVQKGLFNRLVEGPYLTMLLVTFAVAIMLQSFMLQIYNADPRKINVDYGTTFNLGDTVTLSPAKFFTVLASVIMIAGLVAFLRYTRIGYAIRAAAQNKMAARLMGINIAETYAITFAISLGLTGMAGAMMSTFQPVTPVNGPIWTLRAFAIVALGGLGKVQGVIVGGIVLGVAESFIGGYVDVGWAVAVAFILLVIMLVLRPQGITGGLVPAEE